MGIAGGSGSTDEEAADPLPEAEGRASHGRIQPRRLHHYHLISGVRVL